MFHALLEELQSSSVVNRAGFIVADNLVYRRWLRTNPGFRERDFLVLKEWEVTADRAGEPDLSKLSKYERELGVEAGLFGAVVADRRLWMGKDCTYSQDYRRRFTDEELLRILQRGLEEMERVFDELRPDAVASFICVTMLDYLAYMFARSRGVKVLNLRPTRVGDYVTIGSTLNDPSPEFASRYAELQGGAVSPHTDEARAHIGRVRGQHGRYEGVVSPSDTPALRLNPGRRSLPARIRSTLSNYISYRSIVPRDNHVPHPVRAMMFAAFLNPWRARRARAQLRSSYATTETLRGRRYMFYPLHTEPEVSLLVYGRPYVNQTEVIRWLAMSLPADVLLVVKEHPWMVGKRTLGSYRKMMNIPRVRLADPKTEARALVQGAELVAVITGSVALEAAILGKPVITFGDCPYNLLPQSMLRRCDDPRRLPALLQELLETYCLDDAALESYVAGVMDTSIRLNLYSVLLGKKNVHSERTSEFRAEVRRLADHVLARMTSDIAGTTAVHAATW